jgi:hypothetical protein
MLNITTQKAEILRFMTKFCNAFEDVGKCEQERKG